MHAYSFLSHNVGAQISRHEEATPFSPSLVRTSTVYETRRRIGASPLDNQARSTRNLTTNEPKIEEKYEVIVSSKYDESGLKILSPQSLIASSSSSSDKNEGYCINRLYSK